MRLLALYVLVFLVYACEWPFDTDATDSGSLFELTIEHSITRLVDSSGVKLTWSEIIVENFSKVTVERRSFADTGWTLRAILSNPLITTYTDMVNDDADFRYRVTLSDIQGNEKWAEGETTIPKTTSLNIPDDYDSIQAAFQSPVIDDGDSILVSPGTYQGTLAILGKNVLISFAADVGHNVKIGSYTSIMPSVSIGGYCTIGDSCVVGAGVNIRPKIKIEQNCVLGIGSTIMHNVKKNSSVLNGTRNIILKRKKI